MLRTAAFESCFEVGVFLSTTLSTLKVRPPYVPVRYSRASLKFRGQNPTRTAWLLLRFHRKMEKSSAFSTTCLLVMPERDGQVWLRGAGLFTPRSPLWNWLLLLITTAERCSPRSEEHT